MNSNNYYDSSMEFRGSGGSNSNENSKRMSYNPYAQPYISNSSINEGGSGEFPRQEGYCDEYGEYTEDSMVNAYSEEYGEYSGYGNYDQSGNYDTNYDYDYDQQQHDQQQLGEEPIHYSINDESNTPPGCYYPLSLPYMAHIRSAPISALSFDPTADALYVAGHTIQLHNKRPHATYSAPGATRSNLRNNTEHRVSMLATHSFPEGTLYSACAAHDEATLKVLDAISISQFSSPTIRTSTASSSVNTIERDNAVPTHAYRPINAHPPSNITPDLLPPFQKPNIPQSGISHILPFCTPQSLDTNRKYDTATTTDAFVCTVSPSSIRVHTRGAILLSENSTLKGMTCGTFHPSTSMDGTLNVPLATHATVGGISPFSFNTDAIGAQRTSSFGKNAHNLHCIDLYTDGLRVVSSQTIQCNQHQSGGNGHEGVCVMGLAGHSDKNAIVAGCSDGTVRILDGSWRMGNGRTSGGGECARVKAHGGGVTNVSVGGNLICTTGYASRSGGGMGRYDGTVPYAFPDQHVLIFDIRYLGRGGIVHSFSGLKGGPRFVNFLPPQATVGLTTSAENDNSKSSNATPKILIASGQIGGGIQIITPFEGLSSDGNVGGNPQDYLQPTLSSGECITAVAVEGINMAVGTSFGNVLSYRMAGVVSDNLHFGGGNEYGVDTVVGNEASTLLSKEVGMEKRNNALYSSNGDTTIPTKEPLITPPYLMDTPQLSMEPMVLQSSSKIKDDPLIPKSIFNSYVLQKDPSLTRFIARDDRQDDDHYSSFGPLSDNIFRTSSKKLLSKELIKLASKAGSEYIMSVPTSELHLNLLSISSNQVIGGNTRKSKKNSRGETMLVFSNPNKLLFDSNSARSCYDVSADPREKGKQNRRRGGGGVLDSSRSIGSINDENEPTMPQRYKCTYRPPNSIFSAFQFAALNDTVYPGWDYAPSMPNAYVSPVLLLLYFMPEVRNDLLLSQLAFNKSADGDSNDIALISASLTGQSTAGKKQNSPSLSVELGFLFHQIDNISAHAMCYHLAPGESIDQHRAVVGTFVPTNFLSTLSTLPEAAALALLDGAAAACEVARRPEAFYRFLMHHLDREFDLNSNGAGSLPRGGRVNNRHGGSISGKRNNRGNDKALNKKKLIDSLQGLNFTSMNEFVTGSGPPTVSTTRGYTVDLAYDPFIDRVEGPSKLPDFGEVLRYSLCKDVRLRAWCQTTKSFETVIQRKIVTSLPKILSLSCACAGNNSNDGLSLWRKNDGDHWLPENIEVEIEESGNVIVRQLIDVDGSQKEWRVFDGKQLPTNVTDALQKANSIGDGEKLKKNRVKYKLDAVVSFIHDVSGEEQGRDGHHVIHLCVPNGFEKLALVRQIEETKKCLKLKERGQQEEESDILPVSSDDLTIRTFTMNRNVSADDFRCRLKQLEKNLEDLETQPVSSGKWVLFNGPVVSSTVVDDARAFHVQFKEPCIVVFRQVGEDDDEHSNVDLAQTPTIEIPWTVINSSSITNSSMPRFVANSSSDIPGRGDLVAFDAEFVQVQHEESILTASGSKVTIREGRNALARMSLIDCRSGHIIIDDHVLPREPIVDYLTRFSGIRPADLNPRASTHHLITTRDAYLKMRLLLDRGCIFVGHGLSQDFLTVNMYVPPSQVIDTLLIYHQEKRRFISLRFLVNFLLGRDMQQDIHDSIEDARAAFDLYTKAIELKNEGVFDKVLQDIYGYGQRTDWKVGVEDSNL